MASSPRHAIHHLRRMMMPTGGWIAIMGPDGAGKSVVIDAIQQQFRFAYDKVKCFHLRPKSLRRGAATQQVVTNPHGKPPRSPFALSAQDPVYDGGLLAWVCVADCAGNAAFTADCFRSLYLRSSGRQQAGSIWRTSMAASIGRVSRSSSGYGDSCSMPRRMYCGPENGKFPLTRS